MRTRTAAAVAAALLGLAGCGTATTTASEEPASNVQSPGTEAQDDASSDNGGSADQADLSFTAQTLEGDRFDGASLAGEPAVLWFWAPWCPTCRAQAPGVSRLAQDFEGKVNVVGVGGLADATDIRDFGEQVEGPVHLVDAEGAVWRHFGVTAQSTYVVLDAEGNVVAEGYLDDHALRDKVEDLAG